MDPMTNKQPYKATKLWNQLLSSFKEGMRLKRKRWRLKTYEQCFSGAEALDWMYSYLQNSPAFDTNISKEQAYMLLQKFLQSKVFESVLGITSSTQFQDTGHLYQFVSNENNLPPLTNTVKADKSNDKENLSNQNSFTNMLKLLTRRNLRSVSCENLADDVETKNTNQSVKPLQDKKNIASYSNMSTFMFDTADEDQEVFSPSICENNFSRSNSVRLKNRSKLFPTKTDDLFSKHSNDKQSNRFTRSTPLLRARNATVSLGGKRAANEEPVASPAKKTKSDSSLILNKKTRSDSSLLPNKISIREQEKRCLVKNSILPNKAVSILGERPSFIKAVNSVNTYDVKQLPGYKPQSPLPMYFYQTQKAMCGIQTKVESKLAIKKATSSINLTQQSSSSRSSGISDSGVAPDFTALDLSSPTKRRRLHSMRRRSMSQNGSLQATSEKFKSVGDVRDKTVTTKSNSLVNNNFQSAYDVRSNNSRKRNLRSANFELTKATCNSWKLNEVGINSSITNGDIEDTWKSVTLLSLKKILHVERMSDYMDEEMITGKNIMRNVEWKNQDISKDVADWLHSAMGCLINWPDSCTSMEDSVLNDMLNYPGFERDVYQAIKEHYQKTLTEPLIPHHFFSLLLECEVLLQEESERAVKVLQHLFVLLPCWNRRQLQHLFNFLTSVAQNNSLQLAKDLPNKEMVVHSFFRLVARKLKRSMNAVYEDAVSIRITTFIIDNFEHVFKLPAGLRGQVDHKIAVTLGSKPVVRNSPSLLEEDRPASADTALLSSRSLLRDRPIVRRTPSYCMRITKQQYEEQAQVLSKIAVRDLMLSTISDKTLTEKERKRRVKQFEKAYPEICKEYITNHNQSPITNHNDSVCSSTNQFPAFKLASKPSALQEKLL